MGAGALAFLNAKLVRGIDFVLGATEFESVLKDADLVITGEGRIDSQTLHGKLVQGLSGLASQHNVPVVAFCGELDLEPEQIKKAGLLAAFSILQKTASLEEAIEQTAEGLEALAFNIITALLEFQKVQKVGG